MSLDWPDWESVQNVSPKMFGKEQHKLSLVSSVTCSPGGSEMMEITPDDNGFHMVITSVCGMIDWFGPTFLYATHSDDCGSTWLPIANVMVEGSNILHLAEDPGFDFAYPEGVRIYIDNLSDKTRNLWLMITGYEYKAV